MTYEYQKRTKKGNAVPFRGIFFIIIGSFSIILIFAITTFLMSLFSNANDDEVIKGIVSPLQSVIKTVTIPSMLPEITENILQNEQGDYAVYIENLTTGELYERNPDHAFTSASLYKLWVLGEAFRQIENGNLTKSLVMSDTVEQINERFNIASESAERAEGNLSMTVDDALYDMITISDNYSALLLSQTVRLSNVSDFMEEYGYSDSHLNPPTTTARDIATFYKQLYNKEIINEAVSNEMMDHLKDQTWNDRIPKYLPDNTVIAHKTGELDGVKHDAGIVFTDNGDYILVLMSDTESEAHAAEVEAKISKAIYDYFTK